MADSKPVVMFDSCVLIDAIQSTPGRYDEIEPYVLEAEAGRMGIVLSTISLAEVCYLKQQNDIAVPLESQIQAIESWLDREYVRSVDVTRKIARLAARFRSPDSSPRLKTWDAIILATAVTESVSKLLTGDGVILDWDRRLGGTPPLRVVEPDGNPGPLYEPTGAGDDGAEEEGAGAEA